MSYADVEVIVEGAFQASFVVQERWEVEAVVLDEMEMFAAHHLPTQVYVLWHDHEPFDCSCQQYVTDHRPYIEWGNN